MDPLQILIVLGVGVAGGTRNICWSNRHGSIPASVVGTVEYGALIWSFIFGFLFWGEEPAGTVFIGAALVIAAGLVLAWSEHRARRGPQNDRRHALGDGAVQFEKLGTPLSISSFRLVLTRLLSVPSSSCHSTR